MAIMNYTSGEREMSYAMLKRVYQLNPEYEIGLLNLWLYAKLSNNKDEEKRLAKELEHLHVKYENIQDFAYDLGH
jgi:hypothetical protein